MHSFFLHLNLLDDVKSNLIALQKDVTYISKLFTTAQEFEISVTEHQFAIFKSLFPQITQLKVSSKIYIYYLQHIKFIMYYMLSFFEV